MRILRRTLYLVVFVGTILNAQPPGSIWVAVLRSDGIIFPVGQFVDGNWSHPTSVPTYSDIENISDRWYCWSATDDSTVLIPGEAVYFEQFGDDTGWGLISNYCPRVVEQNVDPYPKAGFALSVRCPATGMVTLDSLSIDWTVLSRLLQSAFDSLETLTLQENQSIMANFPSIPPSPGARKNIKLESPHLVGTKTSLDGRHLFHFDITRLYRSGNCFVVSELQGWAVKKQSKYTLLSGDISFGDCDGKGLSDFVQPLGVFQYAKRTFTVVTMIPYEGEYQEVFELSEKGVHVLLNQH